jgi:hypothetical protein
MDSRDNAGMYRPREVEMPEFAQDDISSDGGLR